MKRPLNDPKTPTWLLNKSLLLSDIDRASLIKDIKLYFEVNLQSINSETMIWDAFKAYMRGRLIALASKKHKENNNLGRLYCMT